MLKFMRFVAIVCVCQTPLPRQNAIICAHFFKTLQKLTYRHWHRRTHVRRAHEIDRNIHENNDFLGQKNCSARDNFSSMHWMHLCRFFRSNAIIYFDMCSILCECECKSECCTFYYARVACCMLANSHKIDVYKCVSFILLLTLFYTKHTRTHIQPQIQCNAMQSKRSIACFIVQICANNAHIALSRSFFLLFSLSNVRNVHLHWKYDWLSGKYILKGQQRKNMKEKSNLFFAGWKKSFNKIIIHWNCVNTIDTFAAESKRSVWFVHLFDTFADTQIAIVIRDSFV